MTTLAVLATFGGGQVPSAGRLGLSAALAATPAKSADPYKGYPYRVRFGAKDAAGFSSFSHYFGQVGTQWVNLGAGKTSSVDFQQWADGVNSTIGQGQQTTSRTILVVQVDSMGHAVSSYGYSLCWPRAYQSARDTTKGSKAYLIGQLRLQCSSSAPGSPPPTYLP